MSTLLAVTLPSELVDAMDLAVQRGDAQSRDEFIVGTVNRELRRLAAERDAAILREVGPEDDLDDLAVWTMRNLSGAGPFG
ncbi:MAG: antitoxin [Propionibacteriaceae bacterium]|nr:antitoxin [Propionibacteriaceae bacterium]